MKGVPWVGDGGVSGVSLSVVSSSDNKNGEIAGNGGIWSDDGSLDGSDSESDAGMSVWEGAEEKEPTSWERVKPQLDIAQEVQSIIHIKTKVSE
ncbi:hypothetical protein Tco_0009275 [Tanacetum coccineum]